MRTKTKFFSVFFTLSLSLSLSIIPLSSGSAFLPAEALAKAGAKTASHAHIFTGRVLSVNTDSDTLSLYIAKNQRTYFVHYSTSRLLRGSGGGLQEAELNIGDTAKIKGIAVDAQITAKKLTDLSVRNVKIEGVIGEVSDTEDAFILETKKGDITVNIEDNTDILHKKCREANNPLTKALVRGLFNSNTKEIYKTRSIVMHSL